MFEGQNQYMRYARSSQEAVVFTRSTARCQHLKMENEKRERVHENGGKCS